MSETHVEIELKKGKNAPRYPTEICERKLNLQKVIITEKGTASDLPLVDLQLVDKQGNLYFTAVTGRILNCISAAVKGVNKRNHGVEEP